MLALIKKALILANIVKKRLKGDPNVEMGDDFIIYAQCRSSDTLHD